MKLGGAIFCSAAVLAIAACAGEQGRLEIRSTSTTLAPGDKPVPFRVAEGLGQLALGNVGLALESFRKASREDPSSTAALLGIAASYDKMRRFDLSKRYYEAALALAPGDTQLLGALAASLELQGRRDEAASVRNEITQRLATAAVAAEPNPPSIQVAAAEPIAPVTQASPAPAQVQAIVAVPIVPEPALQAGNAHTRHLAFVPERIAAAVPEPAVQAGTVHQRHIAFVPERVVAADEPAETAPVAVTVAAAEAAQPQIARSVTIKLPPPRPVAAPSAKPQAEEAATLAAKAPAIAPTVTSNDADRKAPRLVRLSRGVIALVTAPGPIWRSEPVSRTAQSTTVRFVPIRKPEEQVAEVRLLNAARVHRLAARTRAYLSGRGWRDIAIGDAESTRKTSLILFPEGQRAQARKLSVHFGFAIAPNDRVRQVTVLLGRDSVRVAGARARA